MPPTPNSKSTSEDAESFSPPRGLIQRAKSELDWAIEERRRRKIRAQITTPLGWLRHGTRTYDEKWKEKNLLTPYSPFPNLAYLDSLFAYLDASNEWLLAHDLPVDAPGKRHRAIEKSRDMIVSWSLVGRCVYKCQTIKQQQVLFQSQNQTKANGLIKYAKYLWLGQEEWLREEFPLAGRLKDMPMDKLIWANGSECIAIPEGADVIRSYHPTTLVMDEAAFQPEGETALDTALPAVAEIILNSSANPGWYAELVDGYEQDDEAA